MLKNENKTKTCDNDQVEITNDRVCIRYTIYDIRYTRVCGSLKMLVSQCSTDEKLTISLPFPPFGTVAPFPSQVKVLHAVRLNERLTFKTFWLRQSPNQFRIYPEMTKRN